MRSRIFLASFIPYLIILAVTIFATFYYVGRIERNIFRETARQEYSRLGQDITKVLESSEDYEEIITAIIERYQMGNHIYAWLINKNGREVAFSRNKRYIDPGSLVYDKKNVLPFILGNLPSGERELTTGQWWKYIRYSEITGTDFVYAVVSSVPAKDFQHNRLISGIWLISTLLLIFGILCSLISSGILSKPLTVTANYANLVSLEQEADKPGITFDADLNIILAALERIKGALAERKPPDLNPLSNLPGNIALEKQLFDAIDSKERFAVGELNLTSFSSYNHRYGFKRGDGIIRFLGGTIQSVLQEHGEKDDFVAHIGGDRFVFITRSAEPDKLCKAVIGIFDEHIRLYYDEVDRTRGYIVSKNRRGEIHKFPFISLCIAVATNLRRPLIHPLQIGHITSEILGFLKKQDTSGFLIDRRLSDREEIQESSESPGFIGAEKLGETKISTQELSAAEKAARAEPDEESGNGEFRKRAYKTRSLDEEGSDSGAEGSEATPPPE